MAMTMTVTRVLGKSKLAKRLAGATCTPDNFSNLINTYSKDTGKELVEDMTKPNPEALNLLANAVGNYHKVFTALKVADNLPTPGKGIWTGSLVNSFYVKSVNAYTVGKYDMKANISISIDESYPVTEHSSAAITVFRATGTRTVGDYPEFIKASIQNTMSNRGDYGIVGGFTAPADVLKQAFGSIGLKVAIGALTKDFKGSNALQYMVNYIDSKSDALSNYIQAIIERVGISRSLKADVTLSKELGRY